MASLHAVTETTKKLFFLSIFATITVIIVILTVRTGVAIKEKFYPTPPPPPTVSFGKLSQIQFLPSTTRKKLTYTLNTISGQLPNFGDRTTVRKAIVKKQELLSLKRAQERAVSMGFSGSGIPVSETLFIWKDTSPISRVLQFDIVSSNFDLTSNFITDPDVIVATNPPSPNESFDMAKTFLSDVSSLPQDLDLQKTKTTLLSIVSGELQEATSISTTQVIRVDFFQKEMDKKTIYYPHPPGSIISVLIAGGKRESQVVEAHFHHYDFEEKSATYPIKSSEEAFNLLKNGSAYIASYFGEGIQIEIRNISIGYYSGTQVQQYLLPVIIFEGDDGFQAYVSAVKDEWILK